MDPLLKDSDNVFKNTDPERFRERFLWRGNVMHLVDKDAPLLPNEVEERKRALCGYRPLWPGAWWGVTEDAPYVDVEKGKTLPLCSKCLVNLALANMREQNNDA